jgi:hypothetical protein
LIFMGISFLKKNSNQSRLEGASTVPAVGMPRREEIVSRKFLYRRLWRFATPVVVLGVFFSGIVRKSAGQERPQLKRPEQMPEVKPPEKKKPKKGKEPRAVGVLELNSGGKGTLIPVAILIDGKFYDASAYKADPVPMALESGTVYEAEDSGDPEGLFTINGARHSKGPGSANPWTATGTYLPKGAEGPKSTRKAEDKPVGLDDNGDGPPRLMRKDAAKPAGNSDAGAASNSAPGTPSTGSSEKTSGTTAGNSQPAGGSSTGAKVGADTTKSADSPATDKPRDANGKPAATEGQKGATSSAAGDSASGQTSGEYYRPQLRRGKPTAPAPAEEDDAAIVKKREVGSSAAEASPASAEPMRMVAAISDEAGPDPQSYKFFWKTGEEEERLKQMMAAAEDAVKAYVAALAKNQISARPAAPKTAAAARNGQVKPVPPVLENVQFHGFDLWRTNQPVMILSAEAHLPVAPGGPAAGGETYSVTVVARTDIYGDLRKLYAGVTDRFHLDVTPRMELVDVVDADGDGRGELLFRETSDAGGGYLIYRATADKLWKMFDSLNAE